MLASTVHVVLPRHLGLYVQQLHENDSHVACCSFHITDLVSTS